MDIRKSDSDPELEAFELLDPDSPAYRSRRPRVDTLEHAILERDSLAVKSLLLGGADPNRIGIAGVRPLSIAIAYRSPKIAKLLINAGAQPNYFKDFSAATDKRNSARSPLWFAMFGDRTESGRSIPTFTHLNYRRTATQWKPYLSLAHLLVAHGADVSATDEAGDSALHHVARLWDRSVAENLVRMLVEGGADLVHVNLSGETPVELISQRTPDRFVGKGAQPFTPAFLAWLDRYRFGHAVGMIRPPQDTELETDEVEPAGLTL